MSLLAREIISLIILIAIVWDTVMTFILLLWIGKIKSRLLMLENEAKKIDDHRSDEHNTGTLRDS